MIPITRVGKTQQHHHVVLAVIPVTRVGKTQQHDHVVLSVIPVTRVTVGAERDANICTRAAPNARSGLLTLRHFRSCCRSITHKSHRRVHRVGSGGGMGRWHATVGSGGGCV